MGPGQSGLAVAAGQTPGGEEEEEEVLEAAEVQKINFSVQVLVCVSVCVCVCVCVSFCLMLLAPAVKTSEAMFF